MESKISPNLSGPESAENTECEMISRRAENKVRKIEGLSNSAKLFRKKFPT